MDGVRIGPLMTRDCGSITYKVESMDTAFQELLADFLLEAEERVSVVESLLLALSNADAEQATGNLAQIKRELHTLKGNAGMMGFDDLQRMAHALEDQVETIDLEAPAVVGLLRGVDAFRLRLQALSTTADTTAERVADAAPDPSALSALAGSRDGGVRVPFAKIDRLVEMVGETLIFRNRLSDAIALGVEHAAVPEGTAAEQQSRNRGDWERVEAARQSLDKTFNALQDYVTDLGMVPLQLLFRSLKRIVHDESAREGKRIELQISGGETPIDKTLLEVAGDALGHLVRNAVIHGIEAPAARRQAGKAEQGTVALHASVEGTEVRIEVRDDGAGIDVDALRERGAEQASDDAYAVVFEEGVSTRTDADLSAGRGVGLAVVKRSVERHGGQVEVRSQRGHGSVFELRLPLTVSILRSLLLTVGDETFALPLTSVIETLNNDDLSHHEVDHLPVVRWRGTLIPRLDLATAFAQTTTDQDAAKQQAGYAVVIAAAGQQRSLIVDDIVGIRDIVVKGLDPIIGQPVGISGSTILGDGQVIMILDPAGLVSIPALVSND